MLTDPLISLPVPIAATQGEVTTGTNTSKFVSPSTLATSLAGKQAARTPLDKVGIHGADIVRAATVNLDTATGDLIDLTGTTTITAFTLADGQRRRVRFTGAGQITAGASLILPTSGNIQTAAGDFADVIGYAGGVVRLVYWKKDGSPTDPLYGSLFDGSAGYVASANEAELANFYSGIGDANTFFGLYWGTPSFDASNLYGIGFAELSNSASRALEADSLDANTFFASSGWGTPSFDASNLYGNAVSLNVNNASSSFRILGGDGQVMVVLDGVPYYPHVAGGVVTFTDSP